MTSEEQSSIICLGLPFGRVHPTVGAGSFDSEDWAQNAYLFRGDLDVTEQLIGIVMHSGVYVAGAKYGEA